MILYLQKGLIAKLMNYWIEEMKKRNIVFSFLFEIPNFYQQFGFGYACPVHFYNYITLEKIMLEDIKSEYEISILEVNDEKAAASLCEMIYNLAENKNCKIGIKAPLNSKFSRYVYKKGARFACNNEIYPGTWAGMYKIINLKNALEALIPSFEKRLSNSRFYNYTKTYKISTDVGEVIIQMKHGKVNILDNGQSDSTISIASKILTPLLTGYKDVSYFEDKLKFNSEEEKAVLKVLFPLEFPYIYDLEYSDEL